MENVGVMVRYGSRKRPSALRTSCLQACVEEICSAMYRCSTVPPVYLHCSSSCSSRASNGSSVKPTGNRSEEHTSELQSLMRISYAVFCLKKTTKYTSQKNYKYMT